MILVVPENPRKDSVFEYYNPEAELSQSFFGF